MRGNRSRFLSGEQRPGVVCQLPHVRSRCGPQRGETGGAEAPAVHMSHSGEHREPPPACVLPALGKWGHQQVFIDGCIFFLKEAEEWNGRS